MTSKSSATEGEKTAHKSGNPKWNLCEISLYFTVVCYLLVCCCDQTPWWPKTTHGRVYLVFRFQGDRSLSSQGDRTAGDRQGSSIGRLRDHILNQAESEVEERWGLKLKSRPSGALPVARIHLPSLPQTEMQSGDQVSKCRSLRRRAQSHLSLQRYQYPNISRRGLNSHQEIKTGGSKAEKGLSKLIRSHNHNDNVKKEREKLSCMETKMGRTSFVFQ